jgi:HAD superfamily phosphoserine phosphatase-like hydrolase
VISSSSFFTVAWLYFRHRVFNLSLIELHRLVFRKLLKGISYSILEREAALFAEEFLSRCLYSPAAAALRAAKQEGDRTVIVSNSPDFLVKPIAHFFQVDAWRATPYEVDEQQHIKGVFSVFDGREKAKYVEECIERLQMDREKVVAYSDSFLDLPFLLTAGNPVAVNPDRKLLKFAREQGWKIL